MLPPLWTETWLLLVLETLNMLPLLVPLCSRKLNPLIYCLLTMWLMRPSILAMAPLVVQLELALMWVYLWFYESELKLAMETVPGSVRLLEIPALRKVILVRPIRRVVEPQSMSTCVHVVLAVLTGRALVVLSVGVLLSPQVIPLQLVLLPDRQILQRQHELARPATLTRETSHALRRLKLRKWWQLRTDELVGDR